MSTDGILRGHVFTYQFAFNMNVIEKIEINHFRSIYKVEIDRLSHVNVFSGLNDVGKSNVIKALNLFFKNQVDWQTDLDFQRDTNACHANKPELEG